MKTLEDYVAPRRVIKEADVPEIVKERAANHEPNRWFVFDTEKKLYGADVLGYKDEDPAVVQMYIYAEDRVKCFSEQITEELIYLDELLSFASGGVLGTIDGDVAYVNDWVDLETVVFEFEGEYFLSENELTLYTDLCGRDQGFSALEDAIKPYISEETHAFIAEFRREMCEHNFSFLATDDIFKEFFQSFFWHYAAGSVETYMSYVHQALDEGMFEVKR